MFFSFSKKINTAQDTQSKTAGFTLIEVLVSMALFTVVTTMAVGTLLVLIDANGKAQNMQLVMTNVSFALDSMTREIRTGYKYECKNDDDDLSKTNADVTPYVDTPNCSGGQENFAFTESDDSLTSGKGSQRIAYKLEGTEIQRRLGNNGSWQAITAPEVTIDTLEFIVTDAKPYYDTPVGNDVKSPTVTIFISGSAGDIDGLDTTFNLQTTVTQNSIDL